MNNLVIRPSRFQIRVSIASLEVRNEPVIIVTRVLAVCLLHDAEMCLPVGEFPPVL